MNNSDLQVSFWLLTLRPLLRRAVPATLVALDFFLVGTALWGGVQFLRTQRHNDALAAAMAQNLLPSALMQQQRRPPSPLIVSTALMPSSDGRYTLLATIRNPSARWAAAALPYAMKVGGETMVSGTTTLLPGEEKYLVAADQTVPASTTPASAMSVEFSEGTWMRKTATQSLPDVALEVLQPQYRIVSTGTPGLSQIVGTVKNRLVSAYPEVEVVAVLVRGQTPVAVASVILFDVQGEEERPFDLRLYGAYAATGVHVKASVTALPRS